MKTRRDSRICMSSMHERTYRRKKVRKESGSVRRIFKENDFTNIDRIYEETKTSNRGAKGFKASTLFCALPLMYLKQWTILNPVKVLSTHKEWLYFLYLKRIKNDELQYLALDRTTFYHFIDRLGEETLIEILIQTALQLKEKGIIKGEKIARDATINPAWYLNGKRSDK